MHTKENELKVRKRRRLTPEEREQQLKLKIKDAKRYIGKNGYFEKLESLSAKNYDSTKLDREAIAFFRGIIDQALYDVLASTDSENRVKALEWFCTSAFDQTCFYADLDVDRVFTEMQSVFNHYSNSKYSKGWKKPVLTSRVSIKDPDDYE